MFSPTKCDRFWCGVCIRAVVGRMEITVSAQQLFNSIKAARRIAGKASSGAAGWKFDSGRLSVEWAGAELTLEGKGDGQGTVRVTDADMRGLVRLPAPKGDIVVQYRDGRLYLDRFSFEATAVAGDPAGLTFVPQLLGIGAPFQAVVALAYQHDSATIEAAGLAATLARAAAEREKKIDLAASALAPLGISRASLAAWVDAELARLARG